MDAFATARPESPSPKRRGRGFARKCERLCCSIFTYFPLAFVYGLTTWAVWVQARVGMRESDIGWIGSTSSAIGIFLYLMANISYTVGVFTDPGSPLSERRGRSRTNRHAYSHLPTTEVPEYSLTVSSTGGMRYCKKCKCPKPDRTHHCSSCKRCVLKMDHHCPWLATCVGFYNYKPFLLFLIYTSLFCWVCFAVSATWVWTKVINGSQFVETEMPINVVLLAVISGIIGLVLSGFTAWHISLAFRGLTTIECLEKTRYLAPVRNTFDRHRQEGQWRGPAVQDSAPDGTLRHTLEGYGQQLLDMHANAIPGVTRAEEGEERPSPVARHREAYFEPHIHEGVNHGQPAPYASPAQQSLYHSYEELERARERDRYQEYLAETQSEKLPNAFDLGWRRNLKHLFGENPLLWFLPICNTTGDGWHWEPSRKWIEAKQQVDRERYEQWTRTQHQAPYPQDRSVQNEGGWYPGNQPWQQPPVNVPGPVDRNGTNGTNERPPTGVSLKTLAPMSPRLRAAQQDFDEDASSDHYSTSSDETVLNHGRSPDAPARSKSGRILDISGRRPSEEEWREWD